MSLSALMDDDHGRVLLIRLRVLLRSWFAARVHVQHIEHDLNVAASELRRRSLDLGGRA
jgi:hypothetical protein